MREYLEKKREQLLFLSSYILSPLMLFVEVYRSVFLNSGLLILLSNMDLQGIDYGVLILIPRHFHQIHLTGPSLT
ncbi:hypothetical protein V6N13_011312 [Hibiscus sabdariffa]